MQSGHEIACVLAMLPKREDSWMFHFPNIKLIDLFAESAGLPLVKAETSGERESELDDMRRVLSGLRVEGVVSGAIASKYQKSRIDTVCNELGLVSIAPLWGRDQIELLREMIDTGFEIIITSVSAQGFDEGWLGKEVDESTLHDLIELERKYGINPSGEGGEYETLVLDAPFFRKRIKPIETQLVWRGTDGHLLIKRAELVEK